MCRFDEKNVLNHYRSPHTFRLSFITYVMLDEYLYLMQCFFNAVFSMSRFFAHRNRLRWASQVLALANSSTCVSQRSYLCLLPESSPIANGVVSDSLLSRLR